MGIGNAHTTEPLAYTTSLSLYNGTTWITNKNITVYVLQ